MAINTLEMAQLFQQSLDKQMLVGATSGWMEALQLIAVMKALTKVP